MKMKKKKKKKKRNDSDDNDIILFIILLLFFNIKFLNVDTHIQLYILSTKSFVFEYYNVFTNLD